MLKELMMIGAMMMTDNQILEELESQIADFKAAALVDPESEETKVVRKKVCTIMTMFLTKTIASSPEKMSQLLARMEKHDRLNDLFKDSDDPEAAN